MENRFRCKRIEVPFELSLKDWLREKESNLHLRVQSPTCCRLHHPARSYRISGHWGSNPEPCANLALTPLIRRVLFQLSYAPSKLVAVEGIEPTSLDYQSSALAIELHRAKWLTRRGSNPHLTA